MKTFIGILIAVVVILGGGLIYLNQQDIPAPTTRVEKPLDDRFSR